MMVPYGILKIMWKPADSLVMTIEQRTTLEAWVRAKTTPQVITLKVKNYLIDFWGTLCPKIDNSAGDTSCTDIEWCGRVCCQSAKWDTFLTEGFLVFRRCE